MGEQQSDSAKKIPLVLVHGWGMNTGVWEPVLPLLTDVFDVIPIALPGHGNSAKTTRDVNDWVAYCLQQAPERALWLAWSLGGQISMQAASAHPERFLGLILLATTPRFVRDESWPHAVEVRVFDDFGRAMGVDVLATLLRFLTLQVRGSRDALSTLKKLKIDFKTRPMPKTSALEDGLFLLKTLDMRDKITPASIPTTWIFGQRDTLIPLEVKNDIASKSPRSRQVVVDGGGHAPFISHPEQIARIVTGFADEL